GLAFHPDGRLAVLLRQGSSYRAEVRTLDDPRPLAAIALPGLASQLAWNPDGRQLAAFWSYRLYLWDTATGALLNLDARKNQALRLACDPRGDFFATNGWEGRLRLWDARTGRQLLSMSLQDNGVHRFSPDGRTLTGPLAPAGWLRLEVAGGREYRTTAVTTTAH